MRASGSSLATLSCRVGKVIIESNKYYLASPTGRLIHESREMRDTDMGYVLVVSCREGVLLKDYVLKKTTDEQRHKLFGILWFQNLKLNANWRNWVFEICDSSDTETVYDFLLDVVKKTKHGGGFRACAFGTKYRHSALYSFLRNFQKINKKIA